jgi:hypothetical protein
MYIASEIVMTVNAKKRSAVLKHVITIAKV